MEQMDRKNMFGRLRVTDSLERGSLTSALFPRLVARLPREIHFPVEWRSMATASLRKIIFSLRYCSPQDAGSSARCVHMRDGDGETRVLSGKEREEGGGYYERVSAGRTEVAQNRH